MLTQKQAELLAFIQTFDAINGYSPSFAEMQAGMNISSKSGIHRLLAALEERCYIQRMHNRKRAIRIIDWPDRHQISTYSDAALLEECARRGLIKFTTV